MHRKVLNAGNISSFIGKHFRNECPQLIRKAGSATAASVRKVLDQELISIREAGTWKNERIITSKQNVSIQVEGSTTKLLNFCANNYLGLSSNPEVIKSGVQALEQYGAGLSSVRFICGTQAEYKSVSWWKWASFCPVCRKAKKRGHGQTFAHVHEKGDFTNQNIHKNLEKKIATFHKREDAILYPSCFDANAGLFEVLLGTEDAVFSDELNHASIIDGIRLCKAQKYRYKHKDMNDLESKLQQAENARIKLIATDGVFSMDGNVAPLKDICDLADKYKALVFIDECHATGFFGKTGRGTEEYWDLTGRVDIINSTLGKALGGAAGGYTTGLKELIDLLRQRSRPYLFSNSIPPPVVACASTAFDIVMRSTEYPEKVAKNTKLFREKMTKAGFNIAGENHPICPVMLGDARLAAVFADEMLQKGIYVIGFSYPVVPKGKARIRVQISASHTPEDIERTVEAFTSVGKKLNVV